MNLKFIKYGSDEYYKAAKLRYKLFYQQHNIPFNSIFSAKEEQDTHAVIIHPKTQHILAYGRLSQNSLNEFQICQMVVKPEYQRQGLGTRILIALVDLAIDRGATLLVLNARVTKVKFYQKYGFKTTGEVFASLETNVPHIKMQKQISR